MVALTINEAARVLSVSPSHVRNMLAAGRLVAVDVGTGTARKASRVSMASIDRLLAESEPQYVQSVGRDRLTSVKEFF